MKFTKITFLIASMFLVFTACEKEDINDNLQKTDYSEQTDMTTGNNQVIETKPNETQSESGEEFTEITFTTIFEGEERSVTFEGDPNKIPPRFMIGEEGEVIIPEQSNSDGWTWKPFTLVWGDNWNTFRGEIGWGPGTTWNDVVDVLKFIATS